MVTIYIQRATNSTLAVPYYSYNISYMLLLKWAPTDPAYNPLCAVPMLAAYLLHSC